MPRVVVLPWTCARTGDCCQRGPVLRTAERDALLAAHPALAIPDDFTPVPGLPGGFLRWHRDPCPALVESAGGGTRCAVYPTRPFNCRRFMCLRPNPKDEPLEIGGPMGCWNASTRVQVSRAARRFYAHNQRRAQRWALSYGWSDDFQRPRG